MAKLVVEDKNTTGTDCIDNDIKNHDKLQLVAGQDDEAARDKAEVGAQPHAATQAEDQLNIDNKCDDTAHPTGVMNTEAEVIAEQENMVATKTNTDNNMGTKGEYKNGLCSSGAPLT